MIRKHEFEEIIANRFSILCGGPRKGSPCGCLGLRCGVTQCHQWWIFAFRSKEIYEKAIQIYRNNQREIDKAVEEIIIKKYIL